MTSQSLYRIIIHIYRCNPRATHTYSNIDNVYNVTFVTIIVANIKLNFNLSCC